MNDHDGERELVLGNKQLLAIFFVATLLCGVFFAMGYVVGGNSAKSAATTTANPDGTAAPVADGKREEPPPSVQAEAPSETTDSGSQVPGSEPRVADNPAAAGPAPSPQTADAPPPPVVVSKPPKVVPPPSATATNPDAGPATAVFVSVPESGASYWQVTASTRPAADVLVKNLRDRGLPAILARSSKPELFEVLVGPYRSTLTLADAKKKLIDLGGFDGLIVHKQP